MGNASEAGLVYARVGWKNQLSGEVFIDNLLFQIRFIIVMIRWTGLAPWEFQFIFTGSLTFSFLSTPAIGGVFECALVRHVVEARLHRRESLLD